MSAKEEPEEAKPGQRDAQRLLCEFIEAYREQPCLWKYASADYRNRLVKERAYARLVEKMREADPRADKDSVMRKINALRTAFRREYKKVRAAGKSGSRGSSYAPSLWYYDLIKFVVDEQDYSDAPPPGVAIVDWIEDNGQWTPGPPDQQQPAAKNSSHPDEALMDFIEDSTPPQAEVKVEQVSPASSRPGSPRPDAPATETTTATTAATTTTTTPPTTTSSLAIEIDSVYSEKPSPTSSRLEAVAAPQTRTPKRLEQHGDLDRFAAYVVSKLRRSSPRQVIIAEKVIAEVLMRANLATLDESTGLTESSKGPTAPS